MNYRHRIPLKRKIKGGVERKTVNICKLKNVQFIVKKIIKRLNKNEVDIIQVSQ